MSAGELDGADGGAGVGATTSVGATTTSGGEYFVVINLFIQMFVRHNAIEE